MSMITLIDKAKESAEAEFNAIANRTWDVKAEEVSETLADGSIVSCKGVCVTAAHSTTVGHTKITWKLNGKRTTAATIEKLYKAISTPEELADIKRWKEKEAWMKKFGF